MYGGKTEGRRGGFQDWKARAWSYNKDGNEMSGITDVSRTAEVHATCERQPLSSYSEAADRKSNGMRRCYRCSKFGHIAKECTQNPPHVKRIKEPREENADETSSIIRKARSMGMRTVDSRAATPLVGKKMAGWARMLDARLPALLDTGSMISIVPVGVLSRVKDSGFDVDNLELIRNGEKIPVYDASNNRMEFLGAVKITVALENEGSSDVAFYISDTRDNEILLETNSLGDLGVSVGFSQLKSDRHNEGSVKESRPVTVAKRIYIPPHGARLVSAHCDVGEQTTKGVVWLSGEE